MKTTAVIAGIIPFLASQAAVVPIKAPSPPPANAPLPAAPKTPSPAAPKPPSVTPSLKVVYIVTNAASTESRALLSARLVKLNATNLRWYQEANLVRAEAPARALAAIRADRDVILVLPDGNRPEPAAPADSPATGPEMSPPPPPQQGQQAGCAASVPPGAFAQFPGMPFTGTPGIGAVPGMAPGIGMPPPLPPQMPPPGTGIGIGPMATGLVDSLAGGVANRLINRPPSCKVSIGKSTANFAAAGGDGVIEVKAGGSCAWQAQSSVPWITITSGSGVSGTGIVSYTVAPGEGKVRSGSISIAMAGGGNPIRGSASLVVKQTNR